MWVQCAPPCTRKIMSHATAAGSRPSGNTITIGCTGCPRRLILAAIANPPSQGLRAELLCQMSISGLFAPSLLLERGSPGTVLERLEMFRILLVILLMIILRRIEFHCRQNFRHNRLFKFPGAGQFFLRSLGDLFLSRVTVKDGCAITGPDIGELAVGLCRINLFPINIEQL